MTVTDTYISDLSGLDGFRPQLIALDLDDTTLSHDDTVSERVVEAIAAVREQGVHVVAATGRSISTTVPVCHAAGIPDWAVCSNGAMLVDVARNTPVDVITFDPEPVLRRVVEMIPDAHLGVEGPDGMFRTNRMFEHSALAMGVREVDFDNLISEPVIRLVVRSDEHMDAGLGHVAAELGLHSVVFGISQFAWMDIGPFGVNKATMLSRLCEQLGVEQSQTMAIGDSMNDREMLTWAGRGVLMGHAVPEMHEYADVLTASERGLGVALALEQCLQ